MEPVTKGIYLKILLHTMKKASGSEIIKKIKEKMDIDFSPVRDYPMETEAKLIHEYLLLTNGVDTEQTQYDFGKLAFEAYLNSVFGKTMFSLMGNDVKKISMGASKALGVVIGGVDVTSEDTGPNSVIVRIKNAILHIRHFDGAFTGMFNSFGYNVKIDCEVITARDYEYRVQWWK